MKIENITTVNDMSDGQTIQALPGHWRLNTSSGHKPLVSVTRKADRLYATSSDGNEYPITGVDGDLATITMI